MFAWTILIWSAIGAFAGFAFRELIGGTPPFGKVGDAILGMLGGALGGLFIALIGGLESFVWIVGSVATALIGAVLAIWVGSLIRRKPV